MITCSIRNNSRKRIAAEKAAAAKLEKVRADQQERLEALTTQQEKLQEEAKTVQLHAENVDKALAVINSALDSGMDWDQLEKVIEVEQQQNQNPIALLIHKLDLEHDAMILRLPTTTTDLGHIDDDSKPTLDVKISLKESAHANANRLFAKYRSSKEKSQKTIEASTKALKAAEENAKRQLAEAQKRSKQTASPGFPVANANHLGLRNSTGSSHQTTTWCSVVAMRTRMNFWSSGICVRGMLTFTQTCTELPLVFCAPNDGADANRKMERQMWYHCQSKH